MPRCLETVRAKGLVERAACVAVHDGLDQDRAFEPCLEALHRVSRLVLGLARQQRERREVATAVGAAIGRVEQERAVVGGLPDELEVP